MRDFLSGRKIWTPHRYQFQTTECGVGVLGIVLAHYGRAVPMEEIRRATGVSRDCLNAADIVAGARAFGLEPKVRRCEPDTLAQFGFPVVVHLKFIHFAVLEGMTPTHVLLNDPHSGRHDKCRDTFDEDFTGIAITFTPTKDFRRDPGLGEHDPAVGRLLRPYLPGLAGAFAGQVLSALALVWLAHQMFQGAFALAAVALFALGLTVRNLLLARIRMRLADDLSGTVMNHILRLHNETLNYRIPDRLAAVLAAPKQITATLMGRLALCWLNLLSVPVLLGGVALFAPGAAAVLATLTALICLCYVVAVPWQSGRASANSEDTAEALAKYIGRPRQWKFAGGDRSFVTLAMGNLARTHQMLLDRHDSDTANALLAGLALPVLMGGAILWSLSEPDQGTIIQVMFLTLAIALPLGRLPRVRGQWRGANRLLADIRDILAAPVMAADPQPPANPDCTGPILVAQGVTHGFSRTRPARLHEISLTLHQGEQLGIAGPSGGGKSTVGRVLAGLVTQWSGTVTYMGVPVSRCHCPVWIDKRGVFFHATLRDNLTLWDKSITDNDIQAALDIACIRTEVAARSQGLDTVLDPRLLAFSGGQMQRFEIARAVLRKPKVIILDEALDALNPEIESQIRNRLSEQGISLIVISHRQSTLAACDRVLIVKNGRIVDRLEEEAPVQHKRAPMDMDTPASVPPIAGLQDAFNTVIREMGLTRNVRGTTLTQLANSANLLFRKQRFRPADWRFEPAPTIILDSPGGASSVEATDSSRPCEGVVLYDARDQKTTSLWLIVRAALERAKRDLARVFALSIGGSVALLALPLALNHAPHSAVTAALAFALVLVGMALMQIASRVAAIRMSFIVERYILLQLLLKCRRIQAGALEKMSFPSLLRAVRVPGYLTEAARTDGPRAISALSLSLFGLAYIAVAHLPTLPELLLVCGLAICLPGIAALCLRNRTEQHQEEELHLARLTSQLMQGLPRLQTLRAESTVSDQWRQVRSDYARTGLALWHRLALIRVMPWAVALIGLATTGLPQQPALAVASLLTLAAAATLGQIGINLVRAYARLTDLRQLLAVPNTTGTAQATKSDALEVSGLSHGFNGTRILKGISAQLVPGSITVLAGASGSGKSTLLDLVLGVMPPEAGDIRHGQASIRDLDELTRNRQIGAVFQHDHLETASTLRSQLSSTELVDVARAWNLLEQVALADDVAAMPMGLQTIVDANTISTGQMQRLLIARQLAADPGLLVLDEAMNAVPDDIEAGLIANFRKLGLTCLIVTHRESTIRLADKVIVLADGKVAHYGGSDAALARPEFCRTLAKERHVFLS